MASLKFSNDQLLRLVGWLSEAPLSGKDSRMRTRFLKFARDRVLEVESARKEILAKYSKKDEAGKAVTENGHYVLETDSRIECLREIDALMMEDFVIDLLESNKETIKCVYEILASSDQKFSNEDAEWYDDVCTIFESITL